MLSVSDGLVLCFHLQSHSPVSDFHIIVRTSLALLLFSGLLFIYVYDYPFRSADDSTHRWCGRFRFCNVHRSRSDGVRICSVSSPPNRVRFLLFFILSLFSVFKTLFQIEVSKSLFFSRLEFSRHSFSAGFVPLSRLSHASTDDWFVTSLSC